MSRIHLRPRHRRGFTAIELLVVVIIIFIIILLLLPATRRSREPARRTQCKSNLRNLMLALHNYHDEHGHFPPAFTTDKKGNRLHSWRTLLLPYLEQGELYGRVDLSKPWNHPANAAIRETEVSVFRCPSAAIERCQTCYVGAMGPSAFFKPDGTTRRMRDLADGTSYTIAITEIPREKTIHWMDPSDDFSLAFLTQSTGMFTGNGQTSSHHGGFQVAMSDGSVRLVSHNASPELRTAMTTIDGGEDIESLNP